MECSRSQPCGAPKSAATEAEPSGAGIKATRTCAACRAEKPAEAFHRQGKRGRHAYCKDCYNGRYRGKARKPTPAILRRAQNVKSRYGLTLEAVEQMKADQGGVCAICAAILIRPHIDHDHETGRVRGLLCHACNIALPAIEGADFLRAALKYLGRR
jgi:hypothetical protein